MLDTHMLAKAAMRPRTDDSRVEPVSPDNPKPDSPDIRELLDPVRPALRQVELKMKGVDSSLFAPLATAFVDLIGSGGKRMRPALALLTAELDRSAHGTAAVSLAAAIEMLHTATLVHDDVIDDALLRRGAPTLNASWTKGATVLAGNFMFGRAAYFAAETGNMRVIDIFSETLQEIVNGELRQLFTRHDYEQDKQEYFQRIYAKTASLFCAATEGAAVLADLSEERVKLLREYGYNLGMAFQIVDDILDFTGDDGTLGKPAGSDLRQGLLTLPFFYYLRSQAHPGRLLADLEACHDHAGMNDPRLWFDAVDDVVQALRASNAIEQAQQDAIEFAALARQSLAPFPNSTYKRSMLGLCDFVVDRTF